MAVRRRRLSFRRGPRQNGRQSLWVQSLWGNISLVASPVGLYAGELIEPQDWEREVQSYTKVPKRAGGPRLEALYLDVASNLQGPAESRFAPVLPEVLVFTQSSQFSNIVTDNASYGSTFNNQRTLMYDPSTLRINSHVTTFDEDGTEWQYSAGRWHIKSKVRLAETAINIAVRHAVNVSAFVEASVQVAFRAYLTLP